jgi:hypothetical protein
MHVNPYSPPQSVVADVNLIQSENGGTTSVAKPVQVHSFGSMVVAGLFGGPIAFGYLAQRNFIALALREKAKFALVLFAAALILWFYVAQYTSPDVISKLLSLLPQLLLWWLAALYLMRGALSKHRASGGNFKSKWLAFGIGVLVNLITQAVFYAVSLIHV